MIAIIFKGILLGLSIGFFFGFGPAFFAIIQTAIYRGPTRGALMALGIFLSDSVMVILTLIGTASILKNSENAEIMGVVGGIVLIIFGIYIFRKKSMRTATEEKKELNLQNPNLILYPFKGFILNIANPAIWLFWAGVIMGVATPFKDQEFKMILFFSATLLTIFTTDLTKVFVSHKLKAIINDRFLMSINKVAGVGLFGFGAYLFIKTILIMVAG